MLIAASPGLPEGTATIPFELLEGLLLIECRAAGADAETTGTFVFDTGAGFLALDHDLAAKLGLADDGDSVRGDVGLATQPLRRLVLGDQTMDRVQPVLTIDGAIIRRVTDREVLGLLGAGLYDDRAVQVDYRARVLRLIPSTGSRDSGATTESTPVEAAAVPMMVARSRAGLGAALAANARGVPFDLAGDGKVLVRARLDLSRFASSRPLTLILDTGATKTVLFRDALQSLEIGFDRWPSLCGLSVPTLFGAPSACLVRMPRVSLDAIAQESEDAGEAAATEAVPETSARGGDGAQAATAGSADSITAPRKPARRLRPVVQAMLGDRRERTSDGDPDRVVENRAPESPATPSPAPATTAAASSSRKATVRANDLDAILMVSELREVLSRVAETPVHGLLGYTFLRNFRVTLDYPNRVAWFEPAADPDPRPFEYSHPGIQLERHGPGLRVVAVAEGSPAAKAKVAVGDTLIRVDSREVGSRDLVEVARWLEGEPGSRVTIELGNRAGRRSVAITRRRLL